MTHPSGSGRERSRLAEETRLRYLYRSLILRGRLRLPREAAVPLIGPDCAYHLYGVEATGEEHSCAPELRQARGGPAGGAGGKP